MKRFATAVVAASTALSLSVAPASAQQLPDDFIHSARPNIPNVDVPEIATDDKLSSGYERCMGLYPVVAKKHNISEQEVVDGLRKQNKYELHTSTKETLCLEMMWIATEKMPEYRNQIIAGAVLSALSVALLVGAGAFFLDQQGIINIPGLQLPELKLPKIELPRF